VYKNSKNFPIFFFKISDSNLAYFVENFIAILTVSLKFLAIDNCEKKIRKIEKSSKNEICPVNIGILALSKNVHSGLKLRLLSVIWSAHKLRSLANSCRFLQELLWRKKCPFLRFFQKLGFLKKIIFLNVFF
jgi:hypothetical protein